MKSQKVFFYIFGKTLMYLQTSALQGVSGTARAAVGVSFLPYWPQTAAQHGPCLPWGPHGDGRAPQSRGSSQQEETCVSPAYAGGNDRC